MYIIRCKANLPCTSANHEEIGKSIYQYIFDNEKQLKEAVNMCLKNNIFFSCVVGNYLFNNNDKSKIQLLENGFLTPSARRGKTFKDTKRQISLSYFSFEYERIAVTN